MRFRRLKVFLSVGGCLAVAACFGGPLPPADPFYLTEAKRSLSQGNYWYERGCSDEAGRFYQTALEQARLSDETVFIVRAQNSLGAAALAQGRLKVAANHLEQALQSSLSLPEKPELDKVLGNLGSLALKSGRRPEAEAFWKKAVETAEGKQENPGLYYCNLARLYLMAGREAEFSHWAGRALEAASKKGSSLSVRADALNLKGHLALASGNNPEAEEAFLKALEVDRKAENPLGLAQDNEALADLATKKGDNSKAAGLWDRVFFLYAALGDAEGRDRAFNQLSRLQKEIGRPKSLAPYEQARQNPQDYMLSGTCP